MRKVLMITVAALALGVTGAAAAPRGGGPGFGHAVGGNGGRGPGMANGAMMAPQTGANVRTNGLAAQNNLGARNNFAPDHMAMVPNRPNGRYAWNGHGHGWDHHHRRFGGGYGWGGLYAYEPNYNACYDYGDGYGYGPYYNGYYNNCYNDYYQPGPGFSF